MGLTVWKKVSLASTHEGRLLPIPIPAILTSIRCLGVQGLWVEGINLAASSRFRLRV